MDKEPNLFKTDHEGNNLKSSLNDTSNENVLQAPKNQKKLVPAKEPYDWKQIGTNFGVLVVTVGLTLSLMNALSTFLSLIGNFVGVFEIFVFPFVMMIILNRRKKIISNWHLVRILHYFYEYYRR